MNITAFGDALIETQDLDPVYVAIYRADLPGLQLCRLLLAYWCFYHLGVAAWLSEHRGSDYYTRMMEAATNITPSPVGGRWPRMAERRHFRGAKCIQAVAYLAERSPYDRVWGLTAFTTEEEIMREVRKWPMFGPWIAFKAADMLERCTTARVRFRPNIGLIYDEPRSALEIFAAQHATRSPSESYNFLLGYFSTRKAPPKLDRRCGPQEVETILCKWKSHVSGHYEVGKDIHETREALAGWGETAERMLEGCPTEVRVPKAHPNRLALC
jgi:hypothetical protein